MNSLTYLSRQFDVLASAKTPPSTPTTEFPSFISDRPEAGDSESGLQRVNTWSTTKSILFSPSSPKRSYSSPADFITLARVAALSPSPSSTSSVSLETQASPPKSTLESLFHRIFLVRVLALAWNTVQAAWTALLEMTSLRKAPATVDVAEKGVTSKESTNNSLLSQPTSDLHPPLLPAAAPYLSSGRSHIDPPAPYDTGSHPHTDSAPASHPASTLNVPSSDTHPSASRSSTPVLATRKTPFHLPKTLVLDLDETLIHSTSRPMSMGVGGSGLFGLPFGRSNKGAGHVVEVVLGGRSTLYHVYKRPFVDFFLRTVCL